MFEYPPISKDIVDIPVDGMFASADWRVISREGDNYYLACGALVFEKPEGGSTHCIKPLYHKNWNHEDFEGRLKANEFDVQNYDQELRNHAQRILLRTGLDPDEVYNALNALFYAGIKFVK